MSVWLFGAFYLGQVLSSEIIAKYSLDLPKPQIETINDLVKTNMSLLVLPNIQIFNSIEENLLDRIIKKAEKDKTILPIDRMFMEEDWIVDVSFGKSAIFFCELPLKIIAMIHSNSLKPNTRFRFIEERFGSPYIVTIALSKRLPKKFRDQFNLR